MKNLDAIAKTIEEHLSKKDAVRETAFSKSRLLIRSCSRVIQKMQQNEDAARDLSELKKDFKVLCGAAFGHPEIYHAAYMQDAFQEYTEAHVLYAMIKGKPLPTPDELGVSPGAYALGLGDVIGELRRFALSAMLKGDMDGARTRLLEMQKIYETICSLTHFSGLIPIKRKQDVARGIIEKTTSEIITTSAAHEIKKYASRGAKNRRRKPKKP